MRESVTYQAILEKGLGIELEQGRLIEARQTVLRIGAKRLGPAPQAVQARLDAIGDLSVLEGMIDRVFEVETWDELLHAA